MKIALVCDDLTQHGGHEKVVLDICNIFPEAPLYTTLATKKWQKICDKRGIKLQTSCLQKLPFKLKLNRLLAPFLVHILALEKFNFDQYDLVISISSRFAHGIITKPQTVHICYMSTVGRMFWESKGYFAYEDFGGFKFLKKLALAFLKIPLSYIRVWDRTAAQRVDYFLANSKMTQARIKKYYQRESEILHPAINLEDFSYEDENHVEKTDEEYFLVLTRLAPWKRVDLAIKACQKLGKNLKIVGTGPDENRLRKLVEGDKRVEFLGYVSGEEKIKYLKNCTALINTQKEDFGLVPLEAMACGRPVIAYQKGGALETIKEGVTGEFFKKQTVDSLSKTLKEFRAEKYQPKDCRKRAEQFSLQGFENKLRVFVKEVIK